MTTAARRRRGCRGLACVRGRADATALRARTPRRTRSSPISRRRAGGQPVRDRPTGQSVPDARRGRCTARSTTRSRRRRSSGPTVGADAPRKLRLLGRGLGVAGSYAKVLLDDDVAEGLRAVRAADRVPARTADARPLSGPPGRAAAGRDHLHRDDGRGARRGSRPGARRRPVCEDLAGRGFTGGRDLPRDRARPDATSAATPEFWESVGFARAIDDERFPVMRRELGLTGRPSSATSAVASAGSRR